MTKIKATLLNGVYVYKGRFFKAGDPQYISKSDMEHLSQHAIIRNKSNGKVFPEQKFDFEVIEDESADLKLNKKMGINKLEDLPRGKARKKTAAKVEDMKVSKEVVEDEDLEDASDE